MAIEDSLLAVYLIGTRREIKSYVCYDLFNTNKLGLLFMAELGAGALSCYFLPENARCAGYVILADWLVRWFSGIYHSMIKQQLDTIPENSGLVGKVRQLI